MSKGWLLVAACWCIAVAASSAAAQSKGACECGAHPPGPPPDRAVAPYAGEPADLSPYAKFAAPYDLNYVHPNIYSGAARDIPDPQGSDRSAHRLLRAHRAQPAADLRVAHVARRTVGRGRSQCPRRLRRQAFQADAAQRLRQLAGEGGLWRRPAHRSHHLGLGLQRSGEDGLRRQGLGDFRLHQFRVDAHRAARGPARRNSHRQLGVHRSHHSRNLHPVVLHRLAGRPGYRASHWPAASLPNWA